MKVSKTENRFETGFEEQNLVCKKPLLTSLKTIQTKYQQHSNLNA